MSELERLGHQTYSPVGRTPSEYKLVAVAPAPLKAASDEPQVAKVKSNQAQPATSTQRDDAAKTTQTARARPRYKDATALVRAVGSAGKVDEDTVRAVHRWLLQLEKNGKPVAHEGVTKRQMAYISRGLHDLDPTQYPSAALWRRPAIAALADPSRVARLARQLQAEARKRAERAASRA